MSIRKNPKVDLRRTYSLVVQVGMVLSLLILILAFRVNLDAGEAMDIETIDQEVVQMEEILQTKQIQKPPPPPRPPVPVEVPNDEILEDEDLDLDASLDIDGPITDLPPPPPEEEQEEEVEPEFFLIVEQMPELIGGWAKLQSRVKYPEMARKAGVEGKVFVQFVVDEKGNPTNITVTRSVGAGLDQEAIRVIRETKFTPGKQRGKAVKVRMSLPITFKLQ